jgi:hypothetical protein
MLVPVQQAGGGAAGKRLRRMQLEWDSEARAEVVSIGRSG